MCKWNWFAALCVVVFVAPVWGQDDTGPAQVSGIYPRLAMFNAEGECGTGAVVPALIRAGTPADGRPIRRAVEWLEAHQNEDGGWGEDLRSYERGAAGEQWRGRGNSTPSQTAWALLALIAAAGQTRTEAIERGVRWLCDNQRDDGGWDEAEFTGTGFPRDFYIRYHLYRQVFPIMALGRYLRRPTLHGDHGGETEKAGRAEKEEQGA